MLGRKKYRKATIIYKSGAKVHLRTADLTVSWNKTTGAVTNFEWEAKHQWPVFAGIHNIEAVYQGWV